MEEGLLTRSITVDHDAKSKSRGLGGDCTDTQPNDSPATFVVVLSTLVALCGSLCCGCIIGYSSPAESGIIEDLDLSIAAYLVFGSIATVGGLAGALVNGRITDLTGCRVLLGGWISTAFAKVLFSFFHIAVVIHFDVRMFNPSSIFHLAIQAA
ncbi:sugar transporter ESL1-like [Ziziphus jujuba]|uniref:Sugar transporter ESL1-like n=1 Tax=Ziziphus jujuba TaxID=326968 RepID=A0ABM3ZUG7_ZIZJJ|nr:sugar transporter ESL1-like [Ziziphus jujuba]